MTQNFDPDAKKDTPGYRERLAALRWQFARNAADMLGIGKPGMTVLENPAVLLSGNGLVRKLRVAHAKGELSAVPEGKRLVEAAKGQVDISLDMHLRKMGGFNREPRQVVKDGKRTTEAGEIVVAGLSTQGMIIAVLAHELEHQRQRNGGVFYPDHCKAVSPQDRLWYARALEADADATAVETAWKLRQKGKPAAWLYLKNGSNYSPPLVAAYERQALADPASVGDGRAKRAAFDAWFSVIARDGEALSQKYNELGFDMIPPAEEVRAAARQGLPLGRMTVEDIERLGGISDVNYLKALGGRALDDPYYRAANLTAAQAQRLAAHEADYAAVARENAAVPQKRMPEQQSQMPAQQNSPPAQQNPLPAKPGSIDITLYAPGYQERMAAAKAAASPRHLKK